MTGVHPAIDALTDFPDWYTSDWEILSAYGQSRADNRAAGTGVVTDDTREPLYPQQCIMMNNNRAPGHAFEDNFTSSSASNIIPFFDGRGVTQESSPTLQISITSPCVVTWPNHGLQDRDNVRFYTTGQLPTGITAESVAYFVLGSSLTENTFQFSTTSGGSAVNTSGSQSGTQTARNFAASAPLGQSLGSMMWWLTQDDATYERPSKRRIYEACGEGGRTIQQLQANAAPSSWGDNIFNRWMRMVTAATTFARVNGRSALVRCIPFLQGEANADYDVNTSESVYTQQAYTLQASARSAIPSITGQTDPIEWIHDIVASTPTGPSNTGFGSAVQTSQLNMAINNVNGHTWTTGPSYWYPFASSEHMTPSGVVRLAEAFARAQSILLNGDQPEFIYPTVFTLTGRVIAISCRVPVPPLVLDTTTTPAMTGPDALGRSYTLGFNFTDSSSRTISSVAVAANGTDILVTLSGVPTGMKTISYAWNGWGSTTYTDPITGESCQTPGSWGNVRDSLAVPSRLVPGAYIRNYVPPFSQVLS